MSDINAATAQPAKPQHNAAAHTAGHNKTQSPNPAKGALAFFDLISSITLPGNTKTTQDTQVFTLNSTDQDATAALDPETLKKFQAVLNSLLHGLPAGQRPVALKLTAAQLQKIAQTTPNTIKADPAAIETMQQALIATGLTPEQLAKLAAFLQQGANGAQDADNSGIKAILIGIIKLVPDEEGHSAPIFLPKALLVSRDGKSDNAAIKDTKKDDKTDTTLAAAMNALVNAILTTGTPPAATSPANTPANTPAPADTQKQTGLQIAQGIPAGLLAGASLPTGKPQSPLSGDAEQIDPTEDAGKPAAPGGLESKKGLGGFDGILKLFEQMQGQSAAKQALFTGALARNLAERIAAQTGPVNSTIPASATGSGAAAGTFSSDASLDSLFPEGLDWNKQTGNSYGLGGLQTGGQTTGAVPATSIVLHTAQAGQAHPATQMVMATLSRSVQTPEAKNITLRLDPPDLGQIQIQMHFTKDKEVKAHMIFEKPATMLMMQRDASQLQQSLQNAGLNTGGQAGLSFELGGQNSFNDNNFNGGSGTGRGRGHRTAAGAEPTIIETHMNWSVDSMTGLHHYNIIV